MMGDRVPSLTAVERAMSPMGSGIIDYLRQPERGRRAAVEAARRVQAGYRRGLGYAGWAPVLTPPASQAKLKKSETPTWGLSLLPERQIRSYGWIPAAGMFNMCPAASVGCAAACLNTAGKGRLGSVQYARAARLGFALAHPYEHGTLIAHELAGAVRSSNGPVLVRLNVISDIRYELLMPEAVRMLADLGVGFYDYTKWSPRLRPGTDFYDLTRSASERHSDADLLALLAGGERVAAVFEGTKRVLLDAIAAGRTWNGFRLVDGMSTDDRTRDPRGSVVVLAPLGDAVGDGSGFVREPVFV